MSGLTSLTSSVHLFDILKMMTFLITSSKNNFDTFLNHQNSKAGKDFSSIAAVQFYIVCTLVYWGLTQSPYTIYSCCRLHPSLKRAAINDSD